MELIREFWTNIITSSNSWLRQAYFIKGQIMKTIFQFVVGMLTCTVMVTVAQAKEVNMTFGLALTPYIMQESNSGIEVDIIREALALKGHTLKPSYNAFALTKQMLIDKKADAAQRGNPEMPDGSGFYYASEPTVVYEDFAISLKKNNLSINTQADLKGKSIVAYHGATSFLGPDYVAAVKGNANYQETTNQKRIPLMLFSGGVQVAICDVNIFKYFTNLVTIVTKDVDTKQELVFHKIFPPSTLKTNNAVFADPQIRDDFDAGLKQLKASGKYQQIVKKYVN
jgi:polar amino acid transport system substrate-binding protein